mgnify:CR=1 FL=1
MKDYLKGWKDEQTAEIPPIPETEEELVVIRQYVPPLEREDEEATTPLKRQRSLKGTMSPRLCWNAM